MENKSNRKYFILNGTNGKAELKRKIKFINKRRRHTKNVFLKKI